MANHLTYDILSRLLDFERSVSVDEKALAERHLARCGRCRSEREWLERVYIFQRSPAERRRFSRL